MSLKRLRVAIDGHTIGRRATGNETYVVGLSTALEREATVEPLLLVDPAEEASHLPTARRGELRFTHPIPRLITELSGAGRKWQADVLHVQYVRPPRSDVPVVTTIHDISFEHYPEYFARASRWRMKLTIPWSARHSDRVLTGSEFSRMDLLEHYGLAADRVVVTPYAADEAFRPLAREVARLQTSALGLPDDYLLCVGNIQPRKNLRRLLNAFARLEPAERIPIVVVGQPALLSSTVFSDVRRLGLADLIHFTGYLPRSVLPAIYGAAHAFAYPSVFEGFGLPVLEALACGTPTLTANTSSLPEVAGEAAILVDPFDEEALADGLRQVIGSETLRASLRAAGPRRAASFSWERCALATAAAYRAAAGGSR